jgi:hypothetical protein
MPHPVIQHGELYPRPALPELRSRSMPSELLERAPFRSSSRMFRSLPRHSPSPSINSSRAGHKLVLCRALGGW